MGDRVHLMPPGRGGRRGSSNEICVAFIVVPAMVVADSAVALDRAPLQAPAKGTIVMAGAPHASFQSLGHGEPLE